MAATETFDWLVQHVWPNPDEETRRFLFEQHDHFLNIRSENERLLFIEELTEQAREMKKQKIR